MPVVRKVAQVLGCFALLVLFGGCHRSGTWENDPQNWERAFGYSKPAEIDLVHSWYWRSPHFTREEEYYFQIRHSDDFKRRLFENNKLRKPTDGEERKAAEFFNTKPGWFIPKPLSEYEVWIYLDILTSNYRVFIDRTTGDIFMTDFSV